MTEAQSRTLPLIQERYRIEVRLGQTRLAEVYRARDERLQRRVLVYLLRKDLLGNEQLRRRFFEECQASARRSHPALVEVFDSGESNGRPFMITEDVVGRPLMQIGALIPDEALLYARQVVGAVATCQDQGLAHPAISSANVLVLDAGRVKLVESWQLPPESVPLDLAHYRAPERARGEPPSPLGTVYALGVLLFESIAGTRPLRGDNQPGAQVGPAGPVPPLAAVRPGLYMPSLDRLLAQATASDPRRRFASAAEFARALDALRNEFSQETQVIPAPPLRDRLRRASATLMGPDPTAVLPPSLPAPPQDTAAGTVPLGKHAIRRRTRLDGARQVLKAWAVLGLMLITILVGGWWLAGVITRQIEGFEVPPIALPSLPQPDWRRDLWDRLPERLRALVPQPQVALVVNTPALNIRPLPGIDNTPLTTLPGGTRVILLEGPVTLESGAEWVRVRSTIDGQEGWVALELLKSE